MLKFFDPLRGFSFITLLIRMVLAFCCGGIVGIEREIKRRPAGFRTHILICVGAAMTTIVSQYLYLEMHYQTDMARIGAQVIAGIGFIGGGTIIVTKRQRIKGLTTAAGLWTTAIIGLAFGMGYYEAGLIATALLMIAELVFSKLEVFMVHHAPEINLYIGDVETGEIQKIEGHLKALGAKILSTEVIRVNNERQYMVSAILLVRLPKNTSTEDLLSSIKQTIGVTEIYSMS